MFKSRVLQIAVPMILSNITVPLLGMVDVGVVGHLHAAYFVAAVGVGVVIFNMLYWGMGFLRMATTGIVAQAFGRQDNKALHLAFWQGLLVSQILALFFLVFQYPLSILAFHLIQATPDVKHYALIFCKVFIWTLPAGLANYILIGLLIGMHRPKIVLLVTLIITLIGIVLDFVFVFGFDWNVAGVAAATLVADYIACAFGLVYVFYLLKQHPAKLDWQEVFEWSRLKNFFSLNKNIFIRTVCLLVVFVYFTRAGAQYGAVVLAANVVLMNFQSFMAFAMDGFANAAEALVGKAVGAKDDVVIMDAIKVTIKWTLWVVIFFVIAYLLLGKQVVYLLTDIASVRETAMQYLVWMIVLPMVSAWGFVFDGIFIGATFAKEMRNTMFVAMLAFIIARLVFYPLDNHGLWLAFFIFMLFRSLAMLFVLLLKIKKSAFIK